MSAEPDLPVTTIFARRVRPGSEVDYEEWLAGIVRASSAFEGYQGTTVLRPGEGRSEFLAITQFDSQPLADRWLRSPEREEWLQRLGQINVCAEDVMSLAGMERWFTLPDHGPTGMPPRYKTASLILLGLYPLVLVLNVVLKPALQGLPGPLQVLASLLVSVPLMVWVVLPFLTRRFAGWLHPKRSAS